MAGYTIYDCHLNGDTMNYGGLEWVVDGERGRMNYPGTLPACLAKRLYSECVDYGEIGIGYCNGCTGTDNHENCMKNRR